MSKKPSIKATDIQPEVYSIYNDYIHSSMNRREFVNKISKYATGALSASAMAAFLLPNYAAAQKVKANDSRLKSEFIEYTSAKGAGTMKALLSRPANAKGKLPGIVVVHENRGLNPHIEDVGRRAALENFISIAPDALTPLGGYPGTDDEGKILQRKRDRNEMLEDFIAAFRYLQTHPECTGAVGVVGFCFGGSISNLMAANLPDLGASVPFYGGQAPLEDVPKIKAPLLLQYASDDKRVNAGIEAYEAELKKHNKEFTTHIYPGTGHGFHNDSTPRYNEKEAKLAWKRTIEFFNKHLRT